MIDRRLVICAVASVAGHLVFARALDHLPPRPNTPDRQVVQVRVVEPPPPAPEPEPPKPPEPEKPPEPVKPVVHAPPKQRAPVAKQAAAPVDTPPVDHPPTTTDTTTTPTFGVTMESTSQAGTGPAMPIGNTTHAAPTAAAAAPVKPLAEPVPAVEVTKMPLPIGVCPGKYTDEALAAGTEGLVTLAVTIDEHGDARDIAVISGLPHGLTRAAITALQACKFSPGERAGVAVPVRLSSYKVRFVHPESGQ